MNQIKNITDKKKKEKDNVLFGVALIVWIDLPQPQVL